MIATFEVTPGTCHDGLEKRGAAHREVIACRSGVISVALHVGGAQTRIARYSRWRDREDYTAMLRTDEMRRRNRDITARYKSVEPLMYEVADMVGQGAARRVEPCMPRPVPRTWRAPMATMTVLRPTSVP